MNEKVIELEKKYQATIRRRATILGVLILVFVLGIGYIGYRIVSRTRGPGSEYRVCPAQLECNSFGRCRCVKESNDQSLPNL